MLSINATLINSAVANDNKRYFWRGSPTMAQRDWLRRGLAQAGGKLPLFDSNGRRMNRALIRACVASGWAEPWFRNPLKPDWLVCKLTSEGRRLIAE